MPKEPEEIYALFEQACARTCAEREQFLAELEQRDREGARELRALLDADRIARGKLDHDLPEGLVAAALASAQPEEAPARVGPYTVVRLLGRGGMGEVHLARQEAPVRREVALKLVRLGFLSEDILARFEQERRVLALLDHAHIARILHAGMDERGRPYFAMELVEGEPLTAHCEKRALGLAARLDLFLQLCEAVEHAHRNGVLHRDLKPSNVLVTTAGCKVIDFGVAKLIGTERASALATANGHFLGTPAYMSPEQAGAAKDVDTRTDIYSLGVLLYELLTGEPPCAAEMKRATGLSGLLRVVRDAEPARPSARRAGVPEDLDWIALKALEKERERRYRSVAELAADVGRFLRHEPIRARPASAAYRLRKLARRHRAAILAGATALAAALVALVSSAAGYVEATRAEARYQESNEHLRRLADRQLLREAERASDAIWPIDPARRDELVRWRATYAEPLAERRALHAARRAELEAVASPYGEADRARDRAGHPRAEELDATRAIVEHYSRPEVQRASEKWEYYVERFSAEAQRLEVAVAERRTWRFESARDQWEHDELAELEVELARFLDPDPHRGAAASVARRIAEAERIASAEREAFRDGSWDSTRAEIRASPRYGGLELGTEQGLVPLGLDPLSGLFEFWHVATGARPRPHTDPGAHGRWQLDDETGLVLVLVPGGEYRLGAQREDPASPHHDPRARSDEAVHAVELWPFFLSKHELTLAQWERATGRFPATGYGPNWPACDVTWSECDELLARHGLTLPTEAQWEAAARGGTETPWWTGASTGSLSGCSNLADRAAEAAYGRLSWQFSRELEDPWHKLAPVDEGRANPFGLHHAAGNVIEWCADPYVAEGWLARDGDGLRSAPGREDALVRSARGGGWQRPAESARSAARESFTRDTQLPYLGVRPARPLDRHRARLASGLVHGAGDEVGR